ncbi:MAG: S8 family serine peptidase [bacterium]
MIKCACRPLLTAIVILFETSVAFGGDASVSSKIDALLAYSIDKNLISGSKLNHVNQYANQKYVDAWITLADPDVSRHWLADMGVIIRTDLGKILTAWLTPDALFRLAVRPEIAYIESAKILRPSLDRSIPEAHVDQIWNQLGINNRGAGVLVGIIDSGIDYRHGDFRTTDDLSRVLAIWDQLDSSGTPPAGFTYGTFWNKNTLDQKTCTHVPRRFHGTHVAGIAAGDGSETGNGQPAFQYIGVAPEAGLLVVNHEDDIRDTQILDAVNWIFQIAGDQPVSINMSFGGHYGLHDGSYTLDQALNQLVGPGKRGKVICAAVGNEGEDPIHAKTVLAGPSNNFYPYLRLRSPEDFDWAMVQIWYPASSSVEARMWIPKDEENSQFALTDWIAKNGRHVFLVNEGIFEGVIATVDAREAPYAINPGFNLITVLLDKNGKNADFSKFSFDIELNGPGAEIEAWMAMAPAGVGFTSNPNDTLLIQPDSESTISTPASADNVIGVANYVTKNAWTTVDGNVHEDTSAIIGNIATTSGRGPLRNGNPKPDLAAPGQYIVAAWEANIQPDYGNRRSQSVSDGKHFIDQGTSMASPHVCGVAALLLQKNPTLDAQQIKQILLQSAVDRGTPGWDGRWGAGKLDAKAAWDRVPVVQSTPTSAPLPTLTPTTTPTATQPPVPTMTAVPTFHEPQTPHRIYEFNQSTLSLCGWTEIPGGFNQADLGSITTAAIPQGVMASTHDHQGLLIEVRDGQIAFLYAHSPVPATAGPVLLRLLVRSSRPEASITLAALKGDLAWSQNVDGSIALNMPVTAKGYMNRDRFICLLYMPDTGDSITPVIQVAAAANAPSVQIWIDRLEVYTLKEGYAYPGSIFYSNEYELYPVFTPSPTASVPSSTPTPFIIPTKIPTPTATTMPIIDTPTPVPIATFTATPRATPSGTPGITPGNEWTVLANDSPSDLPGSPFDIQQLLVRATGNEITFRMVTRGNWESENGRKTDATFDIYIDTDANEATGDELFGAEFLLSVGVDFFTEEYREAVYQWGDPTGLGLFDFYEIHPVKRVESPTLNILDITINRTDIGTPASFDVSSSVLLLDSFESDQCPDEGLVRFP